MTTTPSPTRRHWIAILVALVLVAAACGDDSSGPTATSDDAVSDGSGQDADDNTGGDEPSGDDTSGDDISAGDGDHSSYCALAARQEAIDAEFPFLAASPEEIEAYFVANRDALAQAVGLAPSEIRGDLETILDAFDSDFLPVLAAANWDFLSVGEELEAISDNPVYDAAQDRIEAYDADVCGIADDMFTEGGSPEVSTEGLEALLGSEFGRQALLDGMSADGDITPEQALCMVNNLDVELLTALASGQQSDDMLGPLLAMFDTCGITPDQFS